MDETLHMPGAGTGAGAGPGLDPALTLVHVRLGELAIGVDARFVLHALPRPARLARLPRSHGAIDGVFVDGERTVPLVDLRAWMGVPLDPAAPPAHVLVLGAGGRTIGLAIDAACGLAPVRRSQLRRIHHADAEDGFFHSVAQVGEDGLLSLLDPWCLMERVQAWTEGAAEATSAAAVSGGTRAGAAQRTLALVRLGGVRLAVPAQQVAQVLPRPQHQPLFSGAGSLLGMVEWQGRHLPLVDLAGALALAGSDAPLMLVLEQGESRIAFPIDATLEVRTLPPAALAPAAEAGLAHPLVDAIALDEDGERILVLDDTALLRRHAAPGLAAAGATGSEAGASGAGTQGRRAGAHLVFDTGRFQAIPMDLVQEVLPLPPALAGLAEGAAAPSGLQPTLLWRERSIPVLDLREHGRGEAAAQAPQRLIVVCHGGRHAALRVWDVVELLAAHQGELLAFAAPGKGRMRMITVENEGARLSYPVFDPGSLPFFMPPA